MLEDWTGNDLCWNYLWNSSWNLTTGYVKCAFITKKAMKMAEECTEFERRVFPTIWLMAAPDELELPYSIFVDGGWRTYWE
jgi:hypothetical protein